MKINNAIWVDLLSLQDLFGQMISFFFFLHCFSQFILQPFVKVVYLYEKNYISKEKCALW